MRERWLRWAGNSFAHAIGSELLQPEAQPHTERPTLFAAGRPVSLGALPALHARHWGLRFSTNALKPSCAHPSIMFTAIVCAASSYAASMPISRCR